MKKKPFLMKAAAVRVFLGGITLFVACGTATLASAQTTRTVRVVEYNIQADTTFTIPTCGLIVPPGAVAWTASTKPTVEQLRTSTFIL